MKSAEELYEQIAKQGNGVTARDLIRAAQAEAFAAGAEAMREAAIEIANLSALHHNGVKVGTGIATRIRALPLPTPPTGEK